MEDTWDSLAVKFHDSTYKTLEKLHFQRPTPVQSSCIPLFLKNKDVAAEAVTGSGKTLAFVIPVIEILKNREQPLKKNEIGSIIITPTRELATQIYEVLRQFLSASPDLSLLLMIGGGNQRKDIEDFKENGGNIIVATPGRLAAMFSMKHIGFNLGSSVKSLEVLVLDEADRLLEMGFDASLNTILSYLPKQRRTGLFSATQTDEVEKLIRAGLRNPVRITVKEKMSEMSQDNQRTPSTLKNYCMIVDSDKKLNQLVNFLQAHRQEKVMVFFSTCASVDYFSKVLSELLKKSQVLCIHGKMKQKRNAIFSKFRSMESGVLICTDVMARGVDIPEVNWVIQYDPPTSATSFVHRCGRTARIGNTGNALIFLLPAESSYIKFVEINQKVLIETTETVENVNSCLHKVRKLAQKDRAVFEKGIRAFVSFVRFYAKHECSVIFRLKDLNYGRLATGFGLIKFPKMPELKHKDLTDFQEEDVDIKSIPYRDKNREKQRQAQIKSRQAQIKSGVEHKQKSKLNKHPKTESWSKLKAKKERKRKRKEKKETSNKRKLEACEDDDDDVDDLDSDVRLLKKFKKGKISKEEFDKEFADELEDDTDS